MLPPDAYSDPGKVLKYNTALNIELLRFMSGGRVVGVGGVQTLQMLHMLHLTIPTILKFITLK